MSQENQLSKIQSTVTETNDASSRRALVTALLGGLGVATLAACQSSASPGMDGIGEISAALTGTTLGWADTVLGAAPGVARSGDLALKDSATIGASVVVAKGCVTAGDGGGGLFFWYPSLLSDNGGTVIVPTTNPNNGCWVRVFSGTPDIRWFGASTAWGPGNNPNANGAAISNALSAHSSAQLPAGEYKYSSTISLNSAQNLFGVGPSSILNYTGSGAALSASGATSFSLRKFRLIGASGTEGIWLVNSYHVDIDQLIIDTGFSAAGIRIKSQPTGNSALIRISGCFIHDLGGDGIRLDTSSGNSPNFDIQIVGNLIHANQLYGIRIVAGGTISGCSVHMTNNLIESNTLGGIWGDYLMASSIVGNYFENTTNSTVAFITLGQGNVYGLDIRSNSFSCKLAKLAVALNVSGLASDGINIENNWFQTNATLAASDAAIVVNGSYTNLKVAGNHLHGNFSNKLVYFTTGAPPTGSLVQDTPSIRLAGAIGFYGGAPAAKPSVTGAKGGNVALASLLSALAGLGLITDSTT